MDYRNAKRAEPSQIISDCIGQIFLIEQLMKSINQQIKVINERNYTQIVTNMSSQLKYTNTISLYKNSQHCASLEASRSQLIKSVQSLPISQNNNNNNINTNELQEKLKYYQQKCTSLQSQIDNQIMNQQIQQQRILQLQQQQQQIQQQQQQPPATSYSEVSSVKSIHQNNNNNNSSLIQKYENQLSEADAQIAELQDKTKETIKELTNEIEILTYELNQTKTELINQKNKNNENNRLTKHVEEERKILLNKIKELEGENNERKNKEMFLNNKINDLNNKLNRSNMLIKKYEEKKDFTNDFHDLELKYEKLEQTLDNINQQLVISQQNENHYHQQLYLLEKDFDQLQYQKNENENEKIRLQSSLNEIEIEMKQKNREISFLTNQLNMLKQQQMVGGINGISNGKYNNFYSCPNPMKSMFPPINNRNGANYSSHSEPPQLLLMNHDNNIDLNRNDNDLVEMNENEVVMKSKIGKKKKRM